ncbi:MAG: hypothetical protein JWP57_2173 [Spirosoma sp.]|nr:hypothetical protein [Spirosoma sp.]
MSQNGVGCIEKTTQLHVAPGVHGVDNNLADCITLFIGNFNCFHTGCYQNDDLGLLHCSYRCSEVILPNFSREPDRLFQK